MKPSSAPETSTAIVDSIAAFETLLANPEHGNYVLRLYIAGGTPKSARAVANLKRLCEAKLRGRYELTVIDLYQRPEEAAADQIVAVPTLIKKLPLPLRRLIGDLSDGNRVLLALDIKPDPD